MKVLKRKQIVLGMLVIMMGTVGFLSYSYNNGKTEPVITEKESARNLGEAMYVSTNEEKVSGVIEEALLSRQRARDLEKETLNEIIENKNSDAESIKNANESLLFIAKAIEDENKCETILKSKGIKEVLVYITKGGVNVMVKTAGLTKTEASVIMDTVISVSDIKDANLITISEVK